MNPNVSSKGIIKNKCKKTQNQNYLYKQVHNACLNPFV